jgi:hypothetical protein
LDIANAKVILTPPDDEGPPLSPSKQPGGVLRTPGTAGKGRKTVSFGSHVVDNEGKRGNTGKSGIPNDCPGKFPSPWTPGTELKLDPGSDKRPRTRLTEALLDARTTTQPKSGQRPKARDDSDITMDLGAPRSESGRYWKEQYESYAEKSEKEMKKIIAKQQLAKKFAMKKDAEVTELATKLEQERRKFRQRERELEQQNKEYQEQLRQTVADNASATIEVAVLKARIAVLEKSVAATTSDVLQSKPSFQIYEDTSKDVIQADLEPEKLAEVPFAPNISMASSGKENSSPKPRRHRRQTMPESSARANAPSRLGVAEDEASIILGKSPHAAARNVETTSVTASATIKQIPRLPVKTQKSELRWENSPPTSADAMLPSSPLPMPSPGLDLWEPNNESAILPVDKMAMPNYAGAPYSRPEWNPPPKTQRALKSTTHVKHTAPIKRERKIETSSEPAEETGNIDKSRSTQKAKHDEDIRPKPDATKQDHSKTETSNPKSESSKKTDTSSPSYHSPTDPKFDLSKLTAHHAEGSAQVTKDRAEVGPAERKEQAKRRLEERKKLRKNAPA